METQWKITMFVGMVFIGFQRRNNILFLIKEKRIAPFSDVFHVSLGENDSSFSKNFYTAGGSPKRPPIYV